MRIYRMKNRLEVQELQEIIDFLTNQKLIIYPTETCYGLGGDATQKEAIEKVFCVKHRSRSNPLHIVVSSLEMVSNYAKVNKMVRILFEEFLPGPLTLILESRGVLPSALSAGQKTLGVRFPDHPIPQQIVEALGRPITTTSANLSGQPPTYTAKNAVAQLGESIAAIIDAGQLPYCSPSTVFDLTSVPPRLLRKGPICETDLMDALKETLGA
ncbi:MAG: L-threonylcarbamoyladenylate synthase [Candidatus Heimdallarchaeota archaeon]